MFTIRPLLRLWPFEPVLPVEQLAPILQSRAGYGGLSV